MFNEMFVNALVMGMSYEQFWEQDPQLYFMYLQAYNKKKSIWQEEQNFISWQNGLYVLQALNQAISGFSGKSKEIYPKKPYKPKTKAEELEIKNNTQNIVNVLKQII